MKSNICDFASVSSMNFLLGSLMLVLAAGIMPLAAQTESESSAEDKNKLKPLRSDVGIIGLTANFTALNSFTFFDDNTLMDDGSSELEFVIRDVRTISPRAGVGFQVLTSFFTGGNKSFGLGSWGLGPVIRFYPLWTNRWQPYFQSNMLIGNNLGLGDLAETSNEGQGARIRFGLRVGLAHRLNNSWGVFIEGGPDWESNTLFSADARTLQLNIGFDLYLFN